MSASSSKSGSAISGGEVHLRILATSDLHMHITGHDYYHDRPSPSLGLSRTASLIAQARKEVPGALLFDNGDFLQGTPMGDLMAYEPDKIECSHPMTAAMGVLGYDAVALGNHEFDYGFDLLDKALAKARFPALAANLRRKNPPDHAADIRPWILLRRKLPDASGQLREVTIGVIGLLPPQVMRWSAAVLGGVAEVRCMLETAAREVPAMRAAGADVVIALAHSGLSGKPVSRGMENAILPLARIDGIDALVAGHLHLRFPGPDYSGLPGVDAEGGNVHGKPVVMPGYGGSHLGVIDLTLSPQATGMKIVSSHSELRQISVFGANGPEPRVKESPEILRTTAKAHDATLAYIRRPVGRTSERLQTYFSFAAPCPVIGLINAAQVAYVAEQLGESSFPILSAAAPFKAGGPAGPQNYTDVAPGDITLKGAADMYPFPNTLRVLQVSGAMLRDWLERSASAYLQISPPGTPAQNLLNPSFPGYDFDVLSGVTWQVDISQPARYAADGTPLGAGPGRVRNLCHAGQPVRDRDRFIVATNSYRLGGVGLFAPLEAMQVVLDDRLISRDILIRYISEQGALRNSAEPNWSFSPLGRQRAIMRTGPAAPTDSAQLAPYSPRWLGLDAEGFALIELTL